MPSLTPELGYTAAAAALTGSMWIPIIVNRLAEMGVWKALKNPEPDVRPRAGWAYRLTNAHRNAIENLVVFAPLALGIVLLDLQSPLTGMAAAMFFWSRLAHLAIYTAGIPFFRTVAFLIGFGAQVVLALRLFGVA